MIPCMQVSQRWDIWNNGSDKPYVNAHGTMEGEVILFLFFLKKKKCILFYFK